MWTISEEAFQHFYQHHKETIFTIGNGYLATRGTFEEGYPGERRATFVHGVFDDVPIAFTELANTPNWLPLEIFLEGERFSMDVGTIQAYLRTLDLKTGLLKRIVTWVSPAGREITLTFERFASLADEHLLLLRCTAVPHFDGKLEFHLGFDGCADNMGFAHWNWIAQGVREDEVLYLQSRTRATNIDLVYAMQATYSPKTGHSVAWPATNAPTRALVFSVHSGETITVEKRVGVATSRDTTDPIGLAVDHARNAPSWDEAFEAHRQAWADEWERMDVTIEGDLLAQRAMHANLFQLFIAAPRHDDRVNIGSKTLSGFGYRGHSFWDTEAFMLPVFIYTSPHIARNLLDYRYERLPAARKKAHQNGYQGAQFPWESADTGEEVTPNWMPDFNEPTRLVRIWTGDIEIHISADIARAAWLYWKVTGDEDWFIDRGAELVLDTARFWATRAEWNKSKKRYEYNDVIGPDEYHDHVDNNFYTNYMARWNLKTALEVYSWLERRAPDKLRELHTRLELTEDMLAGWKKVMERIYLPASKDGLVEQFEGYFMRRDVDLAGLEPRLVSAQVYFGIEGANDTQVLKQPDVLMLMFMHGDEFDLDQLRANYEYYTPRTDITYGSSLGPAIQSILACKLGYSHIAYQEFMRAALADLEDRRGNASDGIHGASAGGIWQAAVFGFAGLHLEGDKWEIHPCLPSHWKRLSFHFMHHGKTETVDIQNPAP